MTCEARSLTARTGPGQGRRARPLQRRHRLVAGGEVSVDVDVVGHGPQARAGVRLRARRHERQLLHGAGHRHVEQAGAAGRVAEDLVGLDDDDAVELEALDLLGAEQRHLAGVRAGGGGRRRAARRRRAPATIASCTLERRDDAGEAVAVLDRRRRRAATVAGQLALASCAPTPASWPSTRTLRLALASTPVSGSSRLATVEDRLRHAVADRQLGDVARRPAGRR